MAIIVEIDELPVGTPPSIAISGSVLPTGASTEATLLAANTLLTAMTAKLPATVGTKAAAASLSTTLSTEDRAALDALAGGGTGATGGQGTVAVTATATVIRALTATRKKLTVRNSSASVGAIWLGYTSGVTAGPSGSNFEVLYPGDSIDITNYSGAVYGICDTGLTASAKWGEVTT